MSTIKEAMAKAFEPEFAVTVEPIGDNRRLKVITTVIRSRIRGAYECLSLEEEPNRVVLLVRGKRS